MLNFCVCDFYSHSDENKRFHTDTKGEHSGRCCKTFENCQLRNLVEEQGYYVLTDYGRFQGSRKANVEVHGGATLEEVLAELENQLIQGLDGVDYIRNGDPI